MAQGFSNAPVAEDPLAGVPAHGLRRVWRWALVIALGAFCLGSTPAWFWGALLFFRRDFGLNPFQQSTVVSALLLGAMAGALSAGPAASRLGRRRALGVQGVVSFVGTAVAVAANGYAMLVVAQLVLGLAVGAASATVPVYLSEIAQAEIRGRILTLNPLLITTGLLVASLVNLVFSSSGDWRAMFAVGAVPALALAAGSLWVPESPAWLLERGRFEEAQRMIAAVVGVGRADELIERAAAQNHAAAYSGAPRRTGWRVLLTARVRPALIVGLTLAAVQQFGGINTIIYYAPTIMKEPGLSASNSIFSSVAIGIINLAMTVVAIRLIDRAGRRRLLSVSLAGMLFALVLLGLSFVAGLGSVLSLVFMVLFIGAFAVGLGPVYWALIGEIFPGPARAVGSGAATTVNWAANIAVSLTFLPVADVIGQGETFWIFAVICAFGLWFVTRYVPETREREFDDIDADLQARFGREPSAGQEPIAATEPSRRVAAPDLGTTSVGR